MWHLLFLINDETPGYGYRSLVVVGYFVSRIEETLEI